MAKLKYHKRTNRIITDVFTAVIDYICSLPQGNGFSVEIANLYAWFLLLWWQMVPIQLDGTITPFDHPQHGFPVTANCITKYISSLAYVDDAKKFVAEKCTNITVSGFLELVQGFCNLLTDLSLVIKKGKNPSKCTICLYNIPEDTTLQHLKASHLET
jgi:hypothetical protein